jgi:hypothetical protein
MMKRNNQEESKADGLEAQDHGESLHHICLMLRLSLLFHPLSVWPISVPGEVSKTHVVLVVLVKVWVRMDRSAPLNTFCYSVCDHDHLFTCHLARGFIYLTLYHIACHYSSCTCACYLFVRLMTLAALARAQSHHSNHEYT